MCLEIHLSTDFQIKACEILHDVLEDKLYQPLLGTIDWSDPTNVPTPTHFLGKIILVSTGYRSRSSELPPVLPGAEEEEENSEKNQQLCGQFLDLIAAFGELRYIRDNVSFSDVGKRE